MNNEPRKKQHSQVCDTSKKLSIELKWFYFLGHHRPTVSNLESQSVMNSTSLNGIPLELKFKSEDGIQIEMQGHDMKTQTESIPVMVQSVPPVVHPIPIHPQPSISSHSTRSATDPSQSPQRDVVEISSALTINNVNRFRAVAKARRNVMFLVRKNRNNRLAMHALRGTANETPECILLKDNQIQFLDAQETKGMVRRLNGGTF